MSTLPDTSGGIPVLGVVTPNGKVKHTNSRVELWGLMIGVATVVISVVVGFIAYLDHCRSATIEHDAAVIKKHDEDESLKALKDWRLDADPKIKDLSSKVNGLDSKATSLESSVLSLKQSLDDLALKSNSANDQKIQKLNELLDLAKEAKRQRLTNN